MSARYEALAARLLARFGSTLRRVPSICGELSFELDKADLLTTCRSLRDEEDFRFEMLVDLCGVDYLVYGRDEWATQEEATNSGFSRAAELQPIIVPVEGPLPPRRFAVVYHLLSVSRNHRLRLRVYTGADNPPVVPSVMDIWRSADWYEREAFDLFGILFSGHPDLRRLLTDYGFIGHPFRKDFPLSGNVEVRYDPAKGRVVYRPVTVEPRVLVPKIIRDDNRYRPDLKDRPGNG